ncbi:hypothetical protein M9H77_29763 [Catharanthus roseus]|uniref:Uncharacterized protein n=1 Tax=Catharanthus roseus TaxID=4058 RepID=A0ACB9ZZ75_CATRO|nr:hypothetical protein M9H77_29763 [Catharanthus roseus]
MKKRAVSRRDGGLKEKNVSMSTRACLRFLVRTIGHHLKKGRYLQGIKHGNSIYIVVVLEYLAAKDHELDGNGIRDKKNNMIIPQHVLLAMRNEEELENCWLL